MLTSSFIDENIRVVQIIQMIIRLQHLNSFGSFPQPNRMLTKLKCASISILQHFYIFFPCPKYHKKIGYFCLVKFVFIKKQDKRPDQIPSHTRAEKVKT